MTILHFPVPTGTAGFSRHDLRALQAWGKGSWRIEIDASCDDLGPIAILSEAGKPFGSYAIARETGPVLVWNCESLATVGRFASVTEALAAIPRPAIPSSAGRGAAPLGRDHTQATAQVIPFVRPVPAPGGSRSLHQ